MAAGTSLLEEALQAWTYAREGVLGELDNIPGDSWDWRPHEEARSVAELALHIVEAGLMMTGELTNPEGDFTRQPPPAFTEEHAGHLPDDPGPGALRDLLRSTLEEAVAEFRAAGEVAMLQTIRQFNGEPSTRLGWMHHGIAHEEYHRGQLAMYARTMGLVPALTQMIHGEGAG